MLIVQTAKQFEKDYKKIFKSGQKDMEKSLLSESFLKRGKIDTYAFLV